ncbi:MAG: DoxX family membrane protein [Ignavibacteriae bacterium]|nr:DoxX family membrane protein [Ignavibacteriota bacterium]
MKRVLSNKYVLLISRLVLGSVFIVASIDKIALPEAFAVNIVAYKLLPYGLTNLFALIVPWMELLCGVFLIAGVFLRSSSFMVSLLLSMFTIAMITALVRGLKIDCGCFGVEHASPVSWMRVLEDLGLLVLGIHIFTLSPQEFAEQLVE